MHGAKIYGDKKATLPNTVRKKQVFTGTYFQAPYIPDHLMLLDVISTKWVTGYPSIYQDIVNQFPCFMYKLSQVVFYLPLSIE